MTNDIEIREADRELDHKQLVKLANLSKFTHAFSSIMFSSEEAYEKGWIRVATYDEEIIGLSCVRHKKREPKTVLYFLVIHPVHRCRKIGEMMLKDLEEQTPHDCIKFNVSKENPHARRFYTRHGYKVVDSTTLNGQGWGMEKSW